MSDLNNKLTTLQASRDGIKLALTQKGQVVNNDIRTYATAVSNIQRQTELNIYNQTTEPTNKDGIWLKTNKEVSSIIEDDNVYASEEWEESGLHTISPVDIKRGTYESETSCVCVGTDIYIYIASSTLLYFVK